MHILKSYIRIRAVEKNNKNYFIYYQKRKENSTMKKLLISLLTLTACFMLTYTTTVYANQEDPNAQVMPTNDDDMLEYPFDLYNNQ